MPISQNLLLPKKKRQLFDEVVAYVLDGRLLCECGVRIAVETLFNVSIFKFFYFLPTDIFKNNEETR